MYSSKVSIVIPCYNNGYLLSKMMDCILRQTYSDWELIIVDDCSTDNTQDIVCKYQINEARIKFFIRDREPKGAQTCRNIGSEMAEGEYVLFFDSDDLLADYCLAQRVAFMDNNPSLDFAVFPAVAFNYTPFDRVDMYFGIYQHKNYIKAFIERNLPFVVWNNIYRRKSISEYQLIWDEDLTGLQDSDYNIQAILKGCKFELAFGKVDYFWRVTDNLNSISKSLKKKNNAHLFLFYKILNEFGKISIYKKSIFINAIKITKLYVELDDLLTIKLICIALSDKFNRFEMIRFKINVFFLKIIRTVSAIEFLLYPLLLIREKKCHYKMKQERMIYIKNMVFE